MNTEKLQALFKELHWFVDPADYKATVDQAVHMVTDHSGNPSQLAVSRRIIEAAAGDEPTEDALQERVGEKAMDQEYKNEAVSLFHTAVAKLGQPRVTQIVAYCESAKADVVGTLRAELDYIAANPVAARRR